jgi:hypothetical protein
MNALVASGSRSPPWTTRSEQNNVLVGILHACLSRRTWVDRDSYPEQVPAGVSDDPDCPAVSVDGQLFVAPPTTREVAEALPLQTKPNRDSYDVLIVGAGPAGMAAGVYEQ